MTTYYTQFERPTMEPVYYRGVRPPPYTSDAYKPLPTTFEQIAVVSSNKSHPEHATSEVLPPARNLQPDHMSQHGLQPTPSTTPHIPPGGLSHPIVLPQTSKSFRGAFFSPFVRAYTPELASHGIDQSTFLAFVDGLNECFVVHPAFQTLGVVGGVMSTFYGVHPVQFAGIGLQVASGVASAATSYARTKAFVKAVNADLWHPAGLHCTVMTTKKMMKAVEYPEEKIQLPPLESTNDLGDKRLSDSDFDSHDPKNRPDDPRMRRMRALEGYVMPLDFDVPAAVTPDNLLRRMGNSQAQRLARKQEKKMLKERKEYYKKSAEADAVLKYGDKDMAKHERKIAEIDIQLGSEDDPEKREKLMRKSEKKQAKLQKEAAKHRGKKHAKEVRKHQEEAEEERVKLDKKEQKVAQKIRWIVISKWEPEGSSSDDDDSARD